MDLGFRFDGLGFSGLWVILSSRNHIPQYSYSRFVTSIFNFYVSVRFRFALRLRGLCNLPRSKTTHSKAAIGLFQALIALGVVVVPLFV